MNFEEIQELIEQDGGKFIIVENGKPILVVISFDEYKQKIKKPAVNPVVIPMDNAAKHVKNFDIPFRAGNNKDDQDLTIEDLPI
ncbi:MAG: hypothetical protein Q7T34_02610 [Candidatus Parcubacteria bacterium]|nr:hypothetical protein [Candidatus Parcubacteria bacterium]